MLFRKDKDKGNWIKNEEKIWVQTRASNEVFIHINLCKTIAYSGIALNPFGSLITGTEVRKYNYCGFV